MSQKKVIEYKEEKRNRKETLKKQKQMAMIKSIAACVVAVLIIGTVGFAIYKNANSANNGTDANTVDISSINNYIDTLNLNEAMVVDDEETTSGAASVEETTPDANSVENEK